MRFLSEILEALGERAHEVHGDMNTQLTGFTAVSPGRAGYASFITGDLSTIGAKIEASDSSAFLVPKGADLPARDRRPIIEVARPRLEFARVANDLFPPSRRQHFGGVHSSVEVGQGTSIGSGTVLEAEVVIGRDCVIGPNVVIRQGCTVGDQTIVGPGVVIGEPGFGFERDELGVPIRLPHYGVVNIGNSVEIGANTVIDRGVFINTTIGDHAKLDSHVLIGHNSTVGVAALVIGGAVVCGGVQIGPESWIAPGSTIMEKLTIGKGSTVGIGATACRDVPDGEVVMGMPARPALRVGRS